MAVLLAVAITVFAPGTSSAKVCGGEVACECGDTVQGVAVLPSDLGVCAGLGLAVASGSVLDCAGHTVTGSDLPEARYGVELDTVTGAQVRNCRVTAFRRGLRLRGGGGNLLAGNEVFENKYGIDLADETAANRLEGNIVRDNRDEGIHVGTGANDNLIVGNQVVGNKLENIYLLEARGNRLIGNLVRDGGNAAIFVKHSRDNYVADNIVRDTPIHLRGDSWGNVLEDNDLRSDGYVFEAYEEGSGWSYPHDNQVSGGTVFRAGTCVQLLGAYDNRIQGITVDDCQPVAEVPAGGREPHGNIVELTATRTTEVAERSAVQVWVGARELRTGDVLSLGVVAHNGVRNVALDLYVGLLLPDNRIGFFVSPGVLGGLTTVPSALTPMQVALPGFSLTLPRFVDVALPPGLPTGTYWFFAALLVPGALADGVVATAELAAVDAESFTVQP